MILGEVIGLRALEYNDLAQLQIWRNNERMRRYYREYRELSLGDQEAWYKAICCDNRNFCMFGITALHTGEAPPVASGRLLGVCGLTNINWVIRSAEISFYIGHDDLYVDATFAPDAVRTLCRYAFRTQNMHKVSAEIYHFDTSKKTLFEKMSMHLDGVLRDNAFEDGEYHQSLIYSLLETEFR